LTVRNDSGVVLEIVAWMQDDFRSFGEPSGDLRFEGIALTNFDRLAANAAVIDHEDIPLLSSAE
jgi:hypothetical protein